MKYLTDIFFILCGLLLLIAFYPIVPGVVLGYWINSTLASGLSREKQSLIMWACLALSVVVIALVFKGCPPDGCGIGSDGPTPPDPRPY